MLLEHYAEEHRTIDLERAYEQSHFKPRGLWLSARGEDDWPTWVAQEQFHPEMFTHRHIAILDTTGNFLWIHNEDELRAFHRKYAEPIHPTVRMEQISWKRVAEDYDGLFIVPYLWSMRLDFEMSWYYAWDVASGCVWNLEKVKLLPFEMEDVDAEFDAVLAWINYNATVKLERANNRMYYGVEDPTGGRGRMPLTLDQWRNWPQFEKWKVTA